MTPSCHGVPRTLFAAILIMLGASCTPPRDGEREMISMDSDPVLTLGHGAFVGQDGEEFTPDADFIAALQDHYLATLRERRERDQRMELDRAEIERLEGVVGELVSDSTLAGALVLDRLLDPEAADEAHMVMVNNALRWHYVLELQEEPILPQADGIWTKGIPLEIATKLEEAGLQVFLNTRAGGLAYQEQCLDAGVPVPSRVLSVGDGWENRGTFDNEFISEGAEAELWLWKGEEPAGACLALPRYEVDAMGTVTDDIDLLGVICVGKRSGKACFFDNPQAVTFRRGDTPRIDEFVGGANLVANGQGVCTDCHAGENPFVVHLEKAPFAALTTTLRPDVWHEPLVVNSWPHNPGPTNLLSSVASPRSCISCHRRSYAGRFPEVSQELSGYCGTVLRTATGPKPKRTMPPFGDDTAMFQAHIDALKQACELPVTPPGTVVAVEPRDDPSFVSPPLVYDPIFACATGATVLGATLDAEVQLFVNGAQVATKVPARNPDKIDFGGLMAFAKDDEVKARQVVDGVASGFSPVVTVKDHTEVYPMGLPTPEIDPSTIYECASVIAVRHVPGATVTTWVNGGSEVTRTGGGTGWTTFRPGKTPFAVNDAFTARVGLCGDTSGVSPALVRALVRPEFLPRPTLDPRNTFEGQELVSIEGLTNGSRTTVNEVGTGALGSFSTPVWWQPNYDVATPLGRALTSADSLTIDQKLCDLEVSTDPTRGRPCSELPAPRIRQPSVGQNRVIVTQAIPGARIRVVDAANNELGDGSGAIVLLNRALVAGDILTVVQSLGDCEGRSGYRIAVSDGKQGDPDRDEE